MSTSVPNTESSLLWPLPVEAPFHYRSRRLSYAHAWNEEQQHRRHAQQHQHHHRQLPASSTSSTGGRKDVGSNNSNNNSNPKRPCQHGGGTVFGLAFAPPAATVMTSTATSNATAPFTTTTTSHENNAGQKSMLLWIAACTSLGEICIWQLPPSLSAAAASRLSIEPLFHRDDNRMHDSERPDVALAQDDHYDAGNNSNNSKNRYGCFEDVHHHHHQASMDGATMRRRHRHSQPPTWRCHISAGVLYSIHIVDNASTLSSSSSPLSLPLPSSKLSLLPSSPESSSVTLHSNRLLIATGDEGVFVFDWDQDILPRLQAGAASIPVDDPQKPVVLPPLKPRAHFRPYPSPTERIIEINDCVVVDACHFYAAAGDAFGGYHWHWNYPAAAAATAAATLDANGSTIATTTTILHHGNHIQPTNNINSDPKRMMNPGSTPIPIPILHSDYVTTLTHVPNTSLLLTGSDCGVLSIWKLNHQNQNNNNNNREEAQCIERVSMKQLVMTWDQSTMDDDKSRRRGIPTVKASSSLSLTDTGRRTMTQWRLNRVIARDATWWIIAGQLICYGGNDENQRPCNGFLAVLHGPTRSILSYVETREIIHQIALIPSSSLVRMGGSASLAPPIITANTAAAGNKNNNVATIADWSIISVGNESHITIWNHPLALHLHQQHQQQPQRVWCPTLSPPCAYAVAVHDPTGLVAVGGVGSTIVLFSFHNKNTNNTNNNNKNSNSEKKNHDNDDFCDMDVVGAAVSSTLLYGSLQEDYHLTTMDS